jgi:Bacterial Ig-like domain (group 3)
VSPPSPAPAAPGATLTATITPAGPGTVQFIDGTTPTGSPVAVTAGVASLGTTLTSGSHSLSAVFTPSDQTPVTGFTGSTSATVAYTVDAKRPLCIRICR